MKRKSIIAVLAAVLAVVVLALSAGALASRSLSSPDWAGNVPPAWDSPRIQKELEEIRERQANFDTNALLAAYAGLIPLNDSNALADFSKERENAAKRVTLTDDIYRTCFSWIDESNLFRGGQHGEPDSFSYDGNVYIYGYQIFYNYSSVPKPAGGTVSSLYILNDLPSSVISQVNSNFDAVSSNDYRLSGATARYNCHSYAWHSQDTSLNQHWIDDPSGFIGGGYYKVSTPQAGDIICYFDNGGTTWKTSDDTLLHSGILVYVPSGSYSGNLAAYYTVESKWGAAGLYRHNGYECPYTDYILSYDPTAPSSYRADYVSFYRRSGHTHAFSTYNDYGDDNYHECICSCGTVIHQPHNWVEIHSKGENYIPEFHCTDCGAVSYMQ